MCNENNTATSNCIEEILKVIWVLQNNVCGPDSCLDTCDRPKLECGRKIECNTRPITLYTANGTPWTFPTNRTEPGCEPTETSCVFRVEKIEDGCCTCRVLVPNTNTESVSGYDESYILTDSFFTIKTSCVCAIRCLKDIYIDGL